MIGTQPTGAIEGVVITVSAPGALTVLVDGKHGCLAVVDAKGDVVVRGLVVAQQAVRVATDSYRNMWRGEGYLRVHSDPLFDADGGSNKAAFLSAVAHEGLSVTVDGQPGRMVIIDEAGDVIESRLVAREVGAVAINYLRDQWTREGQLRVLTKPPGR